MAKYVFKLVLEKISIYTYIYIMTEKYLPSNCFCIVLCTIEKCQKQKSNVRKHDPGQISIIPKPELRGFWGSSLIKPPFRVTSADVVIICPDDPVDKT